MWAARSCIAGRSSRPCRRCALLAGPLVAARLRPSSPATSTSRRARVRSRCWPRAGCAFCARRTLAIGRAVAAWPAGAPGPCRRARQVPPAAREGPPRMPVGARGGARPPRPAAVGRGPLPVLVIPPCRVADMECGLSSAHVLRARVCGPSCCGGESAPAVVDACVTADMRGSGPHDRVCDVRSGAAL